MPSPADGMRAFVSTVRDGGGAWFQTGKSYEIEMDEYVMTARAKSVDVDGGDGGGLASRVRDSGPDGTVPDFVREGGGETKPESSSGLVSSDGGRSSRRPSSTTYACVALAIAMLAGWGGLLA
jgi:hypothetical protein